MVTHARLAVAASDGQFMVYSQTTPVARGCDIGFLGVSICSGLICPVIKSHHHMKVLFLASDTAYSIRSASYPATIALVI